MKRISLIKLFLVVLLSVGWIISMEYCVNSIIREKGTADFVQTAYSFPESLQISVWDEEHERQETYGSLSEKLADNEKVLCIVDDGEWMDFSCDELVEETGRDTTLVGKVYHSEVYEAFGSEGIASELQTYEVIIPKYFTPCDVGRYGSKTYMDGDEFIGRTITLTDNKTEYSDEYGRNHLEETYSAVLKVVGTYDNVAAGLEGNVIMYSKATGEKLIQQKYGYDEARLKEYLGKEANIWYIYLADNETLEQVYTELEGEYEGKLSVGVSAIDTESWDNELEYRENVSGISICVCAIMTAITVVLTVLLLRTQFGISRVLGCECLVAAVGLMISFVVNYRFIQEENQLFKSKPEDITRMFEYPAKQLYISAGVAITLVIIGVLLILSGNIYKRRKAGDDKNA